MFSIIVPTFNNLEYLKLCLESIKKILNSIKNYYNVNEGNDGTLSYLKSRIIKLLLVKKIQVYVLLLMTAANKSTKNLLF